MRVLGFFCIASAAACILISCSTTPAARSVTVELFDSSAPSVAPKSTQDPLATPIVPQAPVVSSANAEYFPMVSAAASPELVDRMILPDLPETVMNPDLGFLTPPSPRMRPTFALALPDAPAAGTTATVAAAPQKATAPSSAARATTAAQPRTQAPASSTTPAAAQARAPAAAAATTNSASAASTVPSVAGASAAGSVPSATAATSAGSAQNSPTANAASTPAPSYGTLREIYARVGDELQVGLDGLGFLFLGFPDKPTQSDGISFKSKENRSNKTWFTFKALKLGTYDLDFVQQDNTTGKSVKETVRVHVVSDQDFTTATLPQAATGSTSQEAGDPAYAQTLAGLGQYQAAVSELMKGYVEGNPGLNDQIAALYMRMNSYDAAAKFYAKNLAPQNPFTSSAVNGLMKVAALQKDQQALMANLKQFLALKDSGTEETFILAARMERDNGQIGVGLQLLATYATRFPGGSYRDEADFIAAQMLEADSPFRDITQARDLYNNLLTNYPESAFADTARQRVQYIDRHFIQVR